MDSSTGVSAAGVAAGGVRPGLAGNVGLTLIVGEEARQTAVTDRLVAEARARSIRSCVAMPIPATARRTDYGPVSAGARVVVGRRPMITPVERGSDRIEMLADGTAHLLSPWDRGDTRTDSDKPVEKNRRPQMGAFSSFLVSRGLLR